MNPRGLRRVRIGHEDVRAAPQACRTDAAHGEARLHEGALARYQTVVPGLETMERDPEGGRSRRANRYKELRPILAQGEMYITQIPFPLS